jgi:hypothetical protein
VAAWHWNEAVRIASPPGIACFRAGEAYAHGGISPQECVVPVLEVERGFGATYASIHSVDWRGMRCRVRVETNDPGVKVDLQDELEAGGFEHRGSGERSGRRRRSEFGRAGRPV